MSATAEILLAEDDESDVFLLRRAFKEAGMSHHKLTVTIDGQEAMDFMWHRGHSEEDRLPALALLDLKMPRRTGLDVLEWMRAQPALRCLPAVIFSSSARREDVERAYSLGANAFIVKPASTAQRVEIARFLNEWLRFNQPPLAVTEGFKSATAAHASGAFIGPGGR